jgi:putative oxidoreductase
MSGKLNDVGLLVFRVAISLLMLIPHGWPKLMKLLEGGEIKFFDFLGIGATFSLILAVSSEFFASILVALGIFTRIGSISLIITMFVAAFIVHADDPFSKQEKALMYLVSYLMLFITGPGKISLQTIAEEKFSGLKKFILG